MEKVHHLAAERVTVDCLGCRWAASRGGPRAVIKPCPKCGGPVSIRPAQRVLGRRRGDVQPVLVYLTSQERAELAEMSGEGVGDAARQVILGVLDVRRMRRLAKSAE